VKKTSLYKSVLAALGGSLAVIPASALELGDAKVQSALGQPLRASIAYTLGPNEAISNACVAVQPANGMGRVPSPDRGSIVIGDGVIQYTGKSVVREPLFSIRVTTDCHYTARLSREYMLFIDPVNTTEIAPVVATAPTRVAAQPRPVEQPQRRTPPARQPGTPQEELTASTSGLAVADTPAIETVVPAKESTAYAPPQVAPQPTVVAPEPDATEQLVEISSPAVSELRPGDIIIPTDNPYVEPVEAPLESTVENTVETAVEATDTATTTVADAPVSIIRQPQIARDTETTADRPLWLWAGGAALLAGLVLLGIRVRNYFGSRPIAPAQPPREAPTSDTGDSDDSVSIADSGSIDSLGDVDVLIDDDSPTAENLALDADLLSGSGLADGTDVDIAQDFSFAATTELDLELPAEAAANTDSPETDILPPLHANEQEILDSELLPDDGDYDLSVIVDATKMPNPEDVTRRDLEAVQVDDDDETLIGNEYTVSKEVDYKVLEQDYEDEMTATQAINEEIMKAGEDFALDDDLDATVEFAANEAPKDDKKAG
jgi:hypothetical protein